MCTEPVQRPASSRGRTHHPSRQPAPCPHNIEFSCRPESADRAAVRRTAFFLNRRNPGGQLQRFVMLALFLRYFPDYH